ncbi:MAG: hypothetical protein R6U67_12925 [Sodalinema sp.]|uniref:hypothetical protein n=1 Tax=Sodalinema sp. TaxID=3080550 RepID=UPI0012179778|nr:MAG: hypothetical protein EYR95_13305 [Phormidium sp. SL48-SHIP]
MSDSYCFCTLSVGDRYRNHAKQLAKDIQKYAPGVSFVILTDNPDDFSEFPSVLAFHHRLQSVKGYHDKRFVLEKSLSLFESCFFVDADVRILSPVPDDLNWNPGLTARAGCALVKHLKSIKNNRNVEIVKKVANDVKVDIEQVQWLHEFSFILRRQSGKEVEFFRAWQTLSYFFESEGLYSGEGYSMGLAASKVGLNFSFDRTKWFEIFKDNIEKQRIKQGHSDSTDKTIYFEEHKAIEYPQRNLVRKAISKILNQAIFYYRLLRLRQQRAQDEEFKNIFKK